MEVCYDDSGILWYFRRSYVVFNYVGGGGGGGGLYPCT